MAENESLDLGNPGGQRWNQFHDAVRKGKSSRTAAEIAQRKLPAALRKAFKELVESGVPFDRFIAARHDLKALARLVRQCDGHEYAHLFAEVARAAPISSGEELVRSFVSGIVERISDQVLQSVVDSPNWQSIRKLTDYLREVRNHLDGEIQRISEKLAKDPTWNPTRRRRKKAEKSEDTKQLLGMSIMGMTKK
ncbi:MAG: hypothetical protein WD872_06070 [Pirellulaceae bacterium]